MATWYLDPSAPSGGIGTEVGPFNDQDVALAAMSGGDTLYIAGGVLSAPFGPFPSGTQDIPTRVLGSAGNRFVISGGVPIGTMTQCDSSDEADVGANYASIYKITVSNSLFPGNDPRNGNLCENGEQLTIANERADRTDTFFLTKPEYFHTATSVTTSGANVTGFKLTAVTDLYTKAQLDNSRLYFVSDPNISWNSAVVFDESTDVLGLVSPAAYEDSPVKDNFALLNLLPAMQAGGWGYRDLGNGSSTIYVWPVSAASIAAELIEYSTAPIGLDLDGVSHIEVCDFVVRQISMPSRTSTAGVYSNQFDSHARNVHLHGFEVRNCSTTDDASMVLMSGVDDLWMHDFKLSRNIGGFGVFLQGSGAGRADWPRLRMSAPVSLPEGATITGGTSGQTGVVRFTSNSDIYLTAEASNKPFVVGETVTASGYSGTVANTSQMDNQGDASLVVHMMRPHVHDFEIEFTASATIRGFTCRDAAVHHGWIHDASEESHGNTIYWYQGSHNCLIWGVNGQASGGYLTWQEADSLVVAFTAVSASTAPFGGARAIEQQQNRFSELPGVVYGWKGSYVLNCRGIPEPSRVTDARYGNGFNISSGFAPLNLFTVWNNIHHGSSSESGAALADWDYNINTKGSGTGSALRGPNDVSADWSGLYADAENDDFSYQPGAIIESFTARDWSSLIAGFKSRWPMVNAHATLLGRADPFSEDMVRDTIDWSNPPVGPTRNINADYRTNTSDAPPPPSVTQIYAGTVTLALTTP